MWLRTVMRLWFTVLCNDELWKISLAHLHDILSLRLLCTMDTACIILALPCIFTSFPHMGMLWTLSPDPHMLCESPVMIDSQRETTLSQYFGMFNIILVSVWRIIMDVIWCTTKTDIHSQHTFLSHTLCKRLMCIFLWGEYFCNLIPNLQKLVWQLWRLLHSGSYSR